jgi:hypothetical protein
MYRGAFQGTNLVNARLSIMNLSTIRAYPSSPMPRVCIFLRTA